MIRYLSLSSLPNPKNSPLARFIIAASVVVIALVIAIALLYSYLLGPVQKFAGQEEFIVRPDEPLAEIGVTLQEQGFVKHAWVFEVTTLMTPFSLER